MMTLMTHLIAAPAFAAILFGGSLQVEQPLRSGPPVGAKNNRNGFRPQFVARPGEQRCPV